MEKFYSKIDPGKLLHVIVRGDEIEPGRVDIIGPDNFIQCSMLNMNAGKTFKPHKHIWKERTWQVICQESWHVICGKVRCIFYDLDDTILMEPVLNSGDSSFTLLGGHNYFVLEDGTKVMEYKTGKYEGLQYDKTFIE